MRNLTPSPSNFKSSTCDVQSPDLLLLSTARCLGSLWHHCLSGYGHVYLGGLTHLWHHHQLHHVLPRGTGVLNLLLLYYSEEITLFWYIFHPSKKKISPHLIICYTSSVHFSNAVFNPCLTRSIELDQVTVPLLFRRSTGNIEASKGNPTRALS